jgi:hypothetical protein
MPASRKVRHAPPVLFAVVILLVTLDPRVAHADGILDAMNFNEEVVYSLLSTKTTDPFGTTTEIDTTNLSSRTNVRLNYNLLPKLNLNAGGSYDKNISELSSDTGDTESTITRVRPYVWLNLRDPVFGAAVGYDLAEETVETSGREPTTLTRDTYNGFLTWRPLDLPVTQFRYIRTWTRDDERTSLDTTQDQFFLKSEYTYRGLNAYYAGTYLTTNDELREFESRQTAHEGKLLYATTFLDGRISLITDNRIRLTELETEGVAPRVAGLDAGLALQLLAVAGLSALDDTPVDGPRLAENTALIDGVIDLSAGVNIGFPGAGVLPTLRNVGLDLGNAIAVSRLDVWVTGFTGTLSLDIANFFRWDVYTSPDNLDSSTWSLHAAGLTATFGPFVNRFQISFPTVTTRFIKVVTRSLPGGPIGSTDSTSFTTILITELQAFIDRSAQATAVGRRAETITQTVRTHSAEMKAILFRSPSLYYRLTADYQEFDPDAETRYNISNGLFLIHRLSRIFTLSANASYDFGQEQDQTRTAVLYYAALAATPLLTLRDSLVVSGNRQWTGTTTSMSDSVVLYNTAQLYRGIDATLNLGAVFTSETSEDLDATETARRREYYVNVGTGITPHPSLTLSTYYLGKLTHSSGGATREARDTTENRLDLGLSFAPFRTLSMSAIASVAAQTDRETAVNQSYGLNWAPFPDGTLQLSFFYAENLLQDGTQSRIAQPTVRWYLGARRRSYLEATYQRSTTDGPLVKSESELISTGLNVSF